MRNQLRLWTILIRTSVVVGVLALSIGASGPSHAGDFFVSQQRIVKPRLVIQHAESLRLRIKQIVEGRLRVDAPVGARVLGLGTVISPVAATADGSPMWGAWVDGSYTYLESDEQPNAEFDGPQIAIAVGTDYAVNERVILGVSFEYGHSDIDNNFGGPAFGPGRLVTDSYGVGPYVGVAITDNTLFDATFLYSWGDNDIEDRLSTGEFDHENWSVTANLTHYVDLGHDLTFAPTVGLAYSYNRDDDYIDSALTPFGTQKIYIGVLNFGGTLSYFHAIDDARSIEPSISVEGRWEFDIFGKPPLDAGLTASNLNDPSLSVAISGGLDVALNEAISLSLTGSVGGLGRDDYWEASGGGQVTVLF